MLIEKFLAIPKLSLAPLNTPIEKMERLSKAVKGAPNLFIKRDDFIGQLVWGNKLRKLEYTIAYAKSLGADTLITCGAIQSNHARTTAQVAKRLGLECILVLNGIKPEVETRNYRIVKLMEVPVQIVSNREDREPVMRKVSEDQKRKGKNPYIIPLGASDQFGVPGFVNAIKELIEQQDQYGIKFNHIYHATSSGGTQGGLEAGKRIFRLNDLTITGISADDNQDDIALNVMNAANPFLEQLGSEQLIKKEELSIDADFVGPGYGIPSPESERARSLFLEHEGILIDDTYTSKAAAGLISHCENGRFKKTDNVLFWHTGGLINLF
jgi:1-aminocyclopropane-1-carboxylate deaminase/D-cysteine desulfhydrase-like pyridoxal-dependent ACC family enzyme